jgi:phospholipid-binding lipoprotein MlaA
MGTEHPSHDEPGQSRVRPACVLAAALCFCVGVAFVSAPAWADASGSAAGESGEEEMYDVGDDPLFDEAPVGGDESDPLFDDDFDLDFDDQPAAYPDPFEKFNRGVLSVNSVVDRFLMDPITLVYRFILPERARRSIERFFDNVNSTQTLVNDLFQLEWRDAGTTTARLLVNSTAGIGGLFDPATRWGIEGHVSDFGQTLAIAGAPSGPYFMLPLLGPSNIRDGLGLGVDAIFHPTFFLLGGTDVLFFSGSSGLTERARHYEELKALQESSIDYYAALRSGYYQNRQSEIWSRREDRRHDDQAALPMNTASASLGAIE